MNYRFKLCLRFVRPALLIWTTNWSSDGSRPSILDLQPGHFQSVLSYSVKTGTSLLMGFVHYVCVCVCVCVCVYVNELLTSTYMLNEIVLSTYEREKGPNMLLKAGFVYSRIKFGSPDVLYLGQVYCSY